jgi:hypothetical protein
MSVGFGASAFGASTLGFTTLRFVGVAGFLAVTMIKFLKVF